jgi:hypothetical protein
LLDVWGYPLIGAICTAAYLGVVMLARRLAPAAAENTAGSTP